MERPRDGRGTDLPAVDHHFAGLDHVTGQGEHPFLIVFGRIDGHVAVGPRPEVPFRGQAEHPRGPGARHHGDLGEAVFPRQFAQPGPTPDALGEGLQDVGTEPAVHQQGDDPGVRQERAAVGVVGAQGDPPGVIDPEEPFQADRPLQPVDEVLIGVRDRDDPAARLHLDVDVNPFPAREPGEEVPDRAVGRHARRLTEEDLPDVDRDLRVPVHMIRQVGHARAEQARLRLGAPVAVKLNVCQVDAVPVERLECFQRRFGVTRDAEVQAVKVHRVRQAQFVDRPRQARQDRPGGDPEMFNLVVDRDNIPRPLLPALDAARVDDLDPVPLRRAEQPGDGVAHRVGPPLPDPIHQEMVVPHQDEERLVDQRRVGELVVGVPRRERRDRGVERGRVTEPRVQISGRERRRRAADRPRPGGASDRLQNACPRVPPASSPARR